MDQGKEVSIPGATTDEKGINVHQHCGIGVEGILKNSLYRQSLDNVTVVVVAFQNFKRILCDGSQPQNFEEDISTSKPVGLDLVKQNKNFVT